MSLDGGVGAAAISAEVGPMVRVQRRRGASARTLLLLAVLLVGLAVVLFPIAWMVSMALKPQVEIYTPVPFLLPQRPTLENFVSGWVGSGFSVYFMNSLFVTISRVVLSVIVNTLAGYGFAKCRFRGRNAMFVVALAAMMVPEQTRMIPLYILVGNLGWIDSFSAVIFPAVGVAFGTFVMKQYLETIPDDLLEAARIDGASELRVMWQIVLPLAMPALVVNTVFQFMWGWNDLLYPLLFLHSKQLYTVQLALAFFRDDPSVAGGPIMAMALVATVPILVVFVLLQRYFVRGIALTGLK